MPESTGDIVAILSAGVIARQLRRRPDVENGADRLADPKDMSRENPVHDSLSHIDLKAFGIPNVAAQLQYAMSLLSTSHYFNGSHSCEY